MKRGDRVVRVSGGPLGHNSKIGDVGTIERVFQNDELGQYGFNIVWDRKPDNAEYVAVRRVVALEIYEAAGSASSPSTASGS